MAFDDISEARTPVPFGPDLLQVDIDRLQQLWALKREYSMLI